MDDDRGARTSRAERRPATYRPRSVPRIEPSDVRRRAPRRPHLPGADSRLILQTSTQGENTLHLRRCVALRVEAAPLYRPLRFSRSSFKLIRDGVASASRPTPSTTSPSRFSIFSKGGPPPLNRLLPFERPAWPRRSPAPPPARSRTSGRIG